MRHLRVLFEDQLQITLDAEGSAVIGETAFPPAAILAYDTTAYEAEFKIWLNDQWLPEQEERLEGILSLYGNRKRYNDLCAAVKNDYVSPLVGSGMSAPSGLLTWADFLRSIRKYSNLSADELEGLLNGSAFEEAVDRLVDTMPERLFAERIEHDLRLDDPRTIDGPVRHLPAIFPKLVLTTNLDDILELIYTVHGHVFAHVLSGANIGRYRTLKASSESFLLKLHGDCRSRDGRVLGTNEYEYAYASDGVVYQELSLIFKTKSILFLGCSLGPDRTLELIAKVAAGDLNMPRHYAFLKEPIDEAARIKREHFLTERSLFPIWYQNGHDEDVEALLVGVLRYLGRL
jgi:hypothetical protein